MDVDFSIIDGNSENPLYYEHLRGFYEKSKLSAIKISMNSNSEKNITIDGNKAKIRAQSKNLTDSDINEFMGCLNEVMRYDYLNKDYSLEVFEKTKNKLVGTTIQRKNTIEGLYNEVYQAIYKELGDNVDIDIKSILNNSSKLAFTTISQSKYSTLSSLINSGIKNLPYTILEIRSSGFGISLKRLRSIFKSITSELSSFKYPLIFINHSCGISGLII